MNRNERYSDEALNAFIDGELAAEEEGRLLADINQDQGLADRVCELRRVDDLIRHAYESPPAASSDPTRHAAPRGRYTAVAAAALLAVGGVAGWSGHALVGSYAEPANLLEMARVIHAARPAEDELRVMLHISTGDPLRMNTALDEAEALLQAYRNDHQKVRIEVLTNGGGLNLLRADVSPYRDRVMRLHTTYENLTFLACRNALDRLKAEMGIDVELLPESEIAPSAVGQIIQRQKEGWMYVQI